MISIEGLIVYTCGKCDWIGCCTEPSAGLRWCKLTQTKLRERNGHSHRLACEVLQLTVHMCQRQWTISARHALALRCTLTFLSSTAARETTRSGCQLDRAEGRKATLSKHVLRPVFWTMQEGCLLLMLTWPHMHTRSCFWNKLHTSSEQLVIYATCSDASRQAWIDKPIQVFMCQRRQIDQMPRKLGHCSGRYLRMRELNGSLRQSRVAPKRAGPTEPAAGGGYWV